ncbi:hypothetical protein V6N12_047668 [Hibiscus sabdariffa]|uniref:Uncharacterized protein n=1 Tax=Hibiscus sabdariffa TaxID=183260 RepID=A0ABR2CW54_9ROSI
MEALSSVSATRFFSFPFLPSGLFQDWLHRCPHLSWDYHLLDEDQKSPLLKLPTRVGSSGFPLLQPSRTSAIASFVQVVDA